MSANKHRPHLLVLPEDEEDSRIANGFLLHPEIDLRAIQVLPEAGGWRNVRDEFVKVHVAEMGRNPNRHMVLLVDFDGDDKRYADIMEVVPNDLKDRVFVLGVFEEPVDLRRANLGSLESIGNRLAEECRTRETETWRHALLGHNMAELKRMDTVRSILFPLE